MPLTHHNRAARIAEMALQHPLSQRFSFTATTALIDISRGSSAIASEDADQLLQLAVEACITSEILAARQAEATR